MRVFHGTTIENAKLILSLSTEKVNPVWHCSGEDTALYVYPENKADSYEDDEDYKLELLNSAIESALISTLSCKDENFVVLEMDIDEKYLHDDYSCANMDSTASFIDFDDMDKINFIALHIGSVPNFYKPFIASNIVTNELFITDNLDSKLIELSKIVSDCYSAYEHIYEETHDTNEISIEEFQKNY